MSRRTGHAGSIRRVRLGYVTYTGGRRNPVSADFCGTCRTIGAVETHRRLHASRIGSYAEWTDA